MRARKFLVIWFVFMALLAVLGFAISADELGSLVGLRPSQASAMVESGQGLGATIMPTKVAFVVPSDTPTLAPTGTATRTSTSTRTPTATRTRTRTRTATPTVTATRTDLPVITGTHPPYGPNGKKFARIWISGRNFGSSGQVTFWCGNFGQMTAEVISWSNSQVIAYIPVPPRPGTICELAVVTAGYYSNHGWYTIEIEVPDTPEPPKDTPTPTVTVAVPTGTATATATATVPPVPVITGAFPPNAPAGITIKITGTGLGAAAGTLTFRCGGINYLGGVAVWMANEIWVTVPAIPPPGNCTLIATRTDGRVSNAYPFTVVYPPPPPTATPTTTPKP
ncbi:MAG: IPT/TIG domain-containing protein [Patescibacteria group bacterium]